MSVEDVLDEPFIAWKAPGPCRDFWLALDQRKGHPIRIGREVVTVDECLESILMGAGVAFAQASSRRFYARPGLAFVPTTGLPLTSVVVAWCSITKPRWCGISCMSPARSPRSTGAGYRFRVPCQEALPCNSPVPSPSCWSPGAVDRDDKRRIR
ncbi:LysR substrate-binding domain-containing protein [Streptosporangium lutulentum]